MSDLEERISAIVDRLPGPIGHPGWEAAKAEAKSDLASLAEEHAWMTLMDNG